jgi:YhcH/YjgK/YiaL family protein
MIIGNIVDYKPEQFTSKNLQKAFAFIQKAGLNGLLALPEGKTVIEENELWVNRSAYIGKRFEDCKIEGHEKYMDIQIVLAGEEGIGYVSKREKGLTVSVPYDPVKDRANYTGQLDGIINLQGGFFALVFPDDLHQPCIKVNDETIEKAVLKVRIDW